MKKCKECGGGGKICKELCVSCYSRQWRKTNREKVNANARKWKRNNPEYMREYIGQYHKDNRERRLGCAKEWRKNNTDRVNENSRRWTKNNPKKRREYRLRWQRLNPGRVAQYSLDYIKRNPGRGPRRFRNADYHEWRLGVYERDDYTCQQCFKKGVFLNAHHIKSWAEYPQYRFDIENGVTLCAPCHTKEHRKVRR